jgi:hypothetical protein
LLIKKDRPQIGRLRDIESNILNYISFLAYRCLAYFQRYALVKEGETTNDVFGFLTTEPNREARAIHPKAMPVILRTRGEIDIWMAEPWSDASSLQRPLHDQALTIVAKGEKQDFSI